MASVSVFAEGGCPTLAGSYSTGDVLVTETRQNRIHYYVTLTAMGW